MDEFQSLEEVDQAIASLRKQRALLYVLQGEERRNWALEEVQHLLENLDYDQLRMLASVLTVMSGPGVNLTQFKLKTDWQLTRRGNSE